MTSDALRCGPFALTEVIGRGGFAEVWGGRHLTRDVPVAVKIITSERLRAPRAQALLANEVRAVAGLRHPGIVEVFDFGAVDEGLQAASLGQLREGSPYLVMEQVTGGPLSPASVRNWPELLGALEQILAALAHAHARGVVHRDLKPSNVLLAGPQDLHPGLRLTDWGIAHAVDSDPEQTPDEALGTIRYMAPEQVRGTVRDHGPWTDLYGLGCLIWRLTAGVVPFDATSPTAIAQAQLHAPVPPLMPTFAVPDGLDALVRTLLAKAPADRYQRAGDALRALRSLPSAEEAPLRPTPPSVPVDWRPDPEAQSAVILEGAGLGLFGVRRVPVVGRDSERDALWRQLRVAAEGEEPKAVLLRGEPGMGTSRLAAWLGHHASELGVADAITAEHGLSDSPYVGLPPMFARRFRTAGMTRPQVLARARGRLMRQGVTDEWEWIGMTELIQPATPDEVRAGAPVVRFATTSERHSLIRRQLVREAADRPLIVWLDDVQDAPDVVAFVQHVLQVGGPAPLLLIMTAKPRGPAALEALAESPDLLELDLPPLEERHQRRLVEELLGLAPNLARQVEDRTAGTPLFAVQLVGDLVTRGVLSPGVGGFELAAGAALDLPGDVHSLLQQRLDVLFEGAPEGAHRALQTAAALGRSADGREWNHACGSAGFEIPPRLLDELQQQRLLERTRGGWRFPYRSVHESVLRRAAEVGALPDLHRLCARTLPEVAGDGLPGLAGRVGHHLEAAGDLAEAIAPFLAAAEEHRERGRPAAARSILDRVDRALTVLEAGPDDPRRAEVEILYARIAGHLTDFAETCRRARPVVERARRRGWHDLLPEALRTLAFGLWQLGERERAEALYAEALPRFVTLGRGAGVGRCNLGLGIAAAHRGETDLAEEMFTAGLEAFERADDPRGLADAYGWLGILANRRGDRGRALNWYQRALPAAERVGHRLGVAMIRNSLAVVARQEGRLHDAEDGFRRSVQLAEAIGSGEAVWPRINLALVLMSRGAFGEANSCLDRTLSELEGRGRGELGGLVRVALAACSAAAADWPRFDSHIAEASPLLGGGRRWWARISPKRRPWRRLWRRTQARRGAPGSSGDCFRRRPEGSVQGDQPLLHGLAEDRRELVVVHVRRSEGAEPLDAGPAVDEHEHHHGGLAEAARVHQRLGSTDEPGDPIHHRLQRDRGHLDRRHLLARLLDDLVLPRRLRHDLVVVGAVEPGGVGDRGVELRVVLVLLFGEEFVDAGRRRVRGFGRRRFGRGRGRDGTRRGRRGG